MMLGGINPCIPQQFLDDLMLSVETSPRCSVVFLVATVGKYIREYVCIYIYNQKQYMEHVGCYCSWISGLHRSVVFFC